MYTTKMSKPIDRCRICGNTKLVDILDLGDQCLAAIFPKEGEPDPSLVPMKLVKCDESDSSKCGLLQLSHTVDKDLLYTDHYGYRSGINTTMSKHLKDLVGEIESRAVIESGDVIVDVGSNDCTLLKSYSKGSDLRRVGIDPTGLQFRDYYREDVQLLPQFFSASVYKDSFKDTKVKIITTISMFYDLPNPVGFARDIKAILAEDGVWVTEQSYCVTMLERNSFDTICHEHLEYYTLRQIQFIAKVAGLKIVDVSLNECNGGSFRITLTHEDNHSISVNTAAIEALEAKERDLQFHTNIPFEQFMERCEDLKKQTVKFLTEAVDAGKSIYIYGASTKGNTLLQYYGIDNTVITAAAERNVRKYGCRTPSTNIPIVSEAEMREANPDYLLVLPWHFKDEFIEREQEYIDGGGALVFPLPSLTIHSNKKKY